MSWWEVVQKRVWASSTWRRLVDNHEITSQSLPHAILWLHAMKIDRFDPVLKSCCTNLSHWPPDVKVWLSIRGCNGPLCYLGQHVMTPEDGYLRRRRMKTSTMVDDNKTCSSKYRLNISMGTTTTTRSMRTSRPAPRPPSSTFLYSRPKGQVCCRPQPVIEYRQKGRPSLGFETI